MNKDSKTFMLAAKLRAIGTEEAKKHPGGNIFQNKLEDCQPWAQRAWLAIAKFHMKAVRDAVKEAKV